MRIEPYLPGQVPKKHPLASSMSKILSSRADPNGTLKRMITKPENFGFSAPLFFLQMAHLILWMVAMYISRKEIKQFLVSVASIIVPFIGPLIIIVPSVRQSFRGKI